MKVGQSDEDGCWRWQGKINDRGRGYGDFTFKVAGKPVTVPAHRYAYELWVGFIAPGMQIDHVWPRCKYTDCVRPDHLEQVTPAENTRRYLASLTHCRAGHPFAEFGVQGITGWRCQECARIKNRRHYRKNHPEDAPKAPPKTHCKFGHEFTPENTAINTAGARVCRTCSRERTRRWQEKQRSLLS
jgi:hypothetical protein